MKPISFGRKPKNESRPVCTESPTLTAASRENMERSSRACERCGAARNAAGPSYVFRRLPVTRGTRGDRARPGGGDGPGRLARLPVVCTYAARYGRPIKPARPYPARVRLVSGVGQASGRARCQTERPCLAARRAPGGAGVLHAAAARRLSRADQPAVVHPGAARPRRADRARDGRRGHGRHQAGLGVGGPPARPVPARRLPGRRQAPLARLLDHLRPGASRRAASASRPSCWRRAR